MKTELEVAKENLIGCKKNWSFGAYCCGVDRVYCLKCRPSCETHIASLKREGEFLETYYKRYGKVWEGSCSIQGIKRTEACSDIQDRIQDIKNALAEYSKEGLE